MLCVCVCVRERESCIGPFSSEEASISFGSEKPERTEVMVRIQIVLYYNTDFSWILAVPSSTTLKPRPFRRTTSRQHAVTSKNGTPLMSKESANLKAGTGAGGSQSQITAEKTKRKTKVSKLTTTEASVVLK
ncbi:uncharacterized protein LOC106865833 [Brachypodium distachyon]|uniref:Uncharacterized protein n=1 Tax=Brachypodium distachyon TaxID=15368 RepID=A0A0Q3P1C2_BRADI|nr:uncharacterized protein LOC106865833 [Brachypodium distachyon]KQK23806.1 hypothetical protein BRADI_1g76292v3 [Brachypodium distachyon]|eukprot:XP_014752196.1 uncharacterized protein LOC106865833 [Brachypodium distachyon]